MKRPNQPAAGKAGIARLSTIEHHWPGLPEPALGRFTRYESSIIIGAVVGALCAIVVAVITRWRAGQWRCGTAVVVAIIVGVVTGIPAIWYGWIACVYGVVAGYMLGLVTIREAIHDRNSTHDNAA